MEGTRQRGLLDHQAGEMARQYFEEFKTLRELATIYSVSAVGVQKCLKRNGFDTSKRRFSAPCIRCGNDAMRTRKQLKRTSEKMGVFCSQECYHAHLKEIAIGTGPKRNKWARSVRTYMRRARAIAAQHYGPLPMGSVVHHVNGNDSDNRVENLMLLKDQDSHLKIHRKFGEPVILWDGAEYSTRKITISL